MEYIFGAILLGLAVLCEWLLSDIYASPDVVLDMPKSSQREKGLLLLWDLILLAASWAVPQMPVIVRWFLWFGCCIITAILIQLLIEKPKATERRACVTVVVAFLFIAFFHSLAEKQQREEMAAKLEGDLIGAGESFNDGQARMIPPLQIGTSGTKFFQPPGSPPFWQPFPDAKLSLEAGKNGPLVSTTIRDAEGHTVARIEKTIGKCFRHFALIKITQMMEWR
jgi:hypothetical protein